MDGYYNGDDEVLSSGEIPGVDPLHISPQSSPNSPRPPTFPSAGAPDPTLAYTADGERIKTGGRQKGTPNAKARFDLAMSARVYGLRALATVVEIMEDPDQPPALRLAAASQILDRGYGRPAQVTTHSAPDGGAIQSCLRIEFVGVPPPNSSSSAVQTISPPLPADVIENNANPASRNRPHSPTLDAQTLNSVIQGLPAAKPPWEQ